MTNTAMNETQVISNIVSAFAARPDVTADQIAKLYADLSANMLNGAAPVALSAPGATGMDYDPSDNPKYATLHPNPQTTLSAAARDKRIRDSITDDKIYCLECGQSHKMLKRHLGETHGISEAEYRARWDLDAEYPLVAPSYSRRKADYAKTVGFGKHARTASA